MTTSSDTDNSTMTIPFTQRESVFSSLTFAADPVQDASRRTAFQQLCSTMSSLGGEIVPDIIAQEQEGPNVVHINSLVFGCSADPILLILRSTDTVDIGKVEQLLSVNDVRLASPDLVEQVCGFPPGSVPPIGHSPSNLRTIVDERLLNVDTLWGGGGHPHHSSLLKLETLLKLDHVTMADIAAQSSATIESIQVNGDSELYPRRDAPKPFFPVAPPPLSVAQDYCDSPELSSPLKPEPVTIVGRIMGVRQMAKRLVFADLAPPGYVAQSTCNVDEYPWRSPVDGTEMAVQLIAGKTLCDSLGDIAGPAALRRIKPGHLLLIKGRTNVGNLDSMRNWVNKKSLDIVVASYHVLEEASAFKQAAAPPSIKSNAELRRLQLSASTRQASPPPIREARPPSPRPKSSSSLYLTLNDVYPSQNGASSVAMVDDMNSVKAFAEMISQLLLSLTTSNDETAATATGDDVIHGMNKVGLIGMDCEWRPSFLAASPSEPQPILLLQMSIHPLKQVFLFDAQALFRPLQRENEPMTAVEAAASETLMDVFSSQRLLKVGFQLGQDLRRLASSYPHIPAFRLFNAVTEVATIAKKAMQLTRERNSKYHTASLSRVTEFLLGKSINKDQQVSDWALRPLTEDQIEYASLDAAVSPVLFEKALRMAKAGIFTEDPSRSSSLLQIGRWEDDTMFTGAILSWRFLLLDTSDPGAIRKLKAKRIVGDPYVVTQRWHTGEKQPMPPSVPLNRGKDGPYTDVHGVFRMPSKLVRITAGKDAGTLVDSIVGERVGRSKEKCIDSLLTGEAALPASAKIEFHQRSGYVEFADGVALFVNMPDKNFKRGYPNEWLQDGMILTWYLRKSEWNDGESSLAEKLLGSERADGEPPCVPVLFVRMAKGAFQFLCCGRCRAASTPVEEPEKETRAGVSKVGDWGLVQLQLELLDREKLRESTDFETMVQNWLGNSRDANEIDGESSSVLLEDTKMNDSKSVASKRTKCRTLADVVLVGDVVGAMALAMDSANIPPEERSLARGVETLKYHLSNDASEESRRALELIEEVG